MLSVIITLAFVAFVSLLWWYIMRDLKEITEKQLNKKESPKAEEVPVLTTIADGIGHQSVPAKEPEEVIPVVPILTQELQEKQKRTRKPRKPKDSK